MAKRDEAQLRFHEDSSRVNLLCPSSIRNGKSSTRFSEFNGAIPPVIGNAQPSDVISSLPAEPIELCYRGVNSIHSQNTSFTDFLARRIGTILTARWL